MLKLALSAFMLLILATGVLAFSGDAGDGGCCVTPTFWDQFSPRVLIDLLGEVNWTAVGGIGAILAGVAGMSAWWSGRRLWRTDVHRYVAKDVEKR
jgi:hypothetical protein